MTRRRHSLLPSGLLVLIALTAAACRSTSQDVCLAAQDGLDDLAIVGRQPQVDTQSAEWEAALRHFRRMSGAAKGRGNPRMEESTAAALQHYLTADSTTDPAVRQQALADGEKSLHRVAVDCHLAGLRLDFSG